MQEELEKVRARIIMLESDNLILVENHKKEIKQINEVLKEVTKERDDYRLENEKLRVENERMKEK